MSNRELVVHMRTGQQIDMDEGCAVYGHLSPAEFRDALIRADVWDSRDPIPDHVNQATWRWGFCTCGEEHRRDAYDTAPGRGAFAVTWVY